MTYPANHLALPFLEAAILQLENALSELRNGPEGYRSEREFVKETIETLRAVMVDVRFGDEQRDPAVIAAQAAWRRQTMGR